MGDLRDIYESFNFWKGLAYDHPKGVEKDTAWSLTGIGADFVGFTHTLGTQLGKKLGATIPEAAELPVIENGLLAMMAMANMLGFGDPETGNGFAKGANAFNRIGETLGSTHPPDSWEGSASETYGERNKEQQQRAAEMAENDKTVKEVLHRESEQVEKTRETIDHNSTVLTLSIIPALTAMLWNIPPGSGEAVSLGIQVAAVAGTLPPCLQAFERMTSDAAHNATLIRRAGAGYDRIAADAHPTGAQ
ncbi:EspA/EspE family type VII secretion system effector [Mycobacterium branderi]|uniref:ESX-1 secretion-associated protein EspA/EspE-like domain-containing protein n=1 Tax=Mycobacterium branderi TaxID=43348 RepID=A0A7I7W1M8_9MYCO|nr:EspA/EspE family type VII secretion system effector [Mycobacterium branderi]ORA33556.1 hypothetical protein BST20_22020 [Mycobacterium branderi]BBZ11514.1 hypothetical protein MBRA_17090 [Mycobacterium branderi]